MVIKKVSTVFLHIVPSEGIKWDFAILVVDGE